MAATTPPPRTALLAQGDSSPVGLTDIACLHCQIKPSSKPRYPLLSKSYQLLAHAGRSLGFVGLVQGICMSTSPSALLVPVFMGACFGIFSAELSVKRNSESKRSATAQELCESRCGRRGLPVPNSPYGPYGLCGRKATLNSKSEVFIVPQRIWQDSATQAQRVLSKEKPYEKPAGPFQKGHYTGSAPHPHPRPSQPLQKITLRKTETLPNLSPTVIATREPDPSIFSIRVAHCCRQQGV